MESTTPTTSPNNYAQYCLNRLPCGYCTLLSRPCPMFPAIVSPTWKITCDDKTDGDSVKWIPDPNYIYTAINTGEGE